MAVFTPTITGLTSLTTENINIDNNSITALNSSLEQVSYTSASENLLTYSQDFTNAVYSKIRSSITANTTTAPDGTTTASKIVEDTTNNTHIIRRSFTTVVNTTYPLSCFVKSAGNSRRTGFGATQSGSDIFDIDNGTIITNASGNATMVSFGNGWYRISTTFTATATTTNIDLRIQSNSATDAGNLQGDGTSGYFIWGFQAEVGTSASTYLPTTDSASVGLTGVIRGVGGTTAATASSGGPITIGNTSTTLAVNITATQDYIYLASLTGVAASGTASIGTSNMDLNLSASGTGSVTINEIKTNSVTGEVIPGKIGGTNFTDSLLIGHSTTGTLSSAERNTGVGVGAMLSLTSGDRNTVMGRNTGRLISTGHDNILIGAATGQNISTAEENTAVGTESLLANSTSGHGNTAFGYQTLKVVASGDFNIGIGWKAGDALTNGKGNVIIGSNADVTSATGDRQLVIAGYDGTNTTTWLTGDSSGNVTVAGKIITGDTELQSGAKTTITTGTNIMSVEGTNNGMRLYVKNGGVEGFAAGSEGGLGHGAIALRGQTILVGGNSNKGFAFGRNVSWSDVNTLGQEDIKIKGDTIITTGDVTLANDKKVIFGDAGEHIVGDGTNLTISSSGTTTIDSTSTINLDADNGNIYLKDAGTLFGYLARSSSNFYIKSQISNGDLILQGNDGGSTIIALTLDMSDAGTAIFNHDILPTTDATQDLGSTSKRWNNIYTGDLHLSNESTKSGNSIDGTKGNWTLQEGQSDLFLINNNTGKKYKFKIEEIE